jgi:hypothetical protein
MMAKKKIDEAVFQIKISLGSRPLIWRRILVPSVFTLKKLHEAIQIVMGWQNSHLHQFVIGEDRYSDYKSEYDEDVDIKSTKIKLSKIFEETKQLVYKYDFGDGWRHEILLEETLEAQNAFATQYALEERMLALLRIVVVSGVL